MKKIFTLAAGLLMTVLVFAADRRPTVTVNSMKNYKIVIDGKAYFGSNTSISINSLYDGRHTIQVFEMKKGFFGRKNTEKMISSSAFRVDKNDVVISIDYSGKINVREVKRNNRFERNDRSNRDWGHDQGNDRRDDNRRF